MKKEIKWIVKNWARIPDKFKTNLGSGRYSSAKGLTRDDEIVILLLDRQKPSVVACYDFDEERIGVTRDGKVLWGFDSGCSCPNPWENTEYTIEKTWNEFEVNLKNFDVQVIEECTAKIDEIKATMI